MRTISHFKILLLCFTLLVCWGCSPSIDFYLLNKQRVNVEGLSSSSNDEGQADSLINYRGKWLVINFWAEWCAPCREEIPELNLLHKNTENLNLVIIGVSYDPLKNDVIKQIIKDWDIQYPVIASHPVPILPFKLPNKLPGNYILNPNGEIVAKVSGKQSLLSITKLLKALKKEHNQTQ
jgi:thiol-disulfide isomerase/thioredoxin